MYDNEFSDLFIRLNGRPPTKKDLELVVAQIQAAKKSSTRDLTNFDAAIHAHLELNELPPSYAAEIIGNAGFSSKPKMSLEHVALGTAVVASGASFALLGLEGALVTAGALGILGGAFAAARSATTLAFQNYYQKKARQIQDKFYSPLDTLLSYRPPSTIDQKTKDLLILEMMNLPWQKFMSEPKSYKEDRGLKSTLLDQTYGSVRIIGVNLDSHYIQSMDESKHSEGFFIAKFIDGQLEEIYQYLHLYWWPGRIDNRVGPELKNTLFFENGTITKVHTEDVFYFSSPGLPYVQKIANNEIQFEARGKESIKHYIAHGSRIWDEFVALYTRGPNSSDVYNRDVIDLGPDSIKLLG